MSLKTMEPKRTYRADIDGLRAVAVIAVLFFHARFTHFAGGYVGVDVFFVISGFLITQLLIRDIQSGTFSILTFYERRIRRIFPAFFGIAIGVSLAGWWLYSPDQFLAMVQSVFAAALSWANILFWSQAGYWDTASELKPLLHTWSLGVEEQFYIFYPIILFLTMKYAPKHVLKVLWAIVIGTFALSVYAVSVDPNSAFYLAHLRAWELIIGGLIAFHPVKLSTLWRNISTLLGMALILASVFLFNGATPFPGASALLPVLGSALIINAGISGDSWVGKLLATPPFTFTGKISYSLYLWHWPVLVFGSYYLIVKATTVQKLEMLAASYVLSVLSWWLIERPFRNGAFLSRSVVFAIAGVSAACFIGVYFVAIHYQGFPERFADFYAKYDPNWNEEFQTYYECTSAYAQLGRLSEDNLCRLGVKDPGKTPEFMLFGDSHANALASGVNASALANNRTGVLAWAGSCLPSPDEKLTYSRENLGENCHDFVAGTLTYLEQHPNIKTVYIASRWSRHVLKYDYEGNYLPGLPTLNALNEGVNNKNIVFKTVMLETITAIHLMGKDIVIILDVPYVPYEVPSSTFIAFKKGVDINKLIAPSMSVHRKYNKRVNSIFSEIAAEIPDVSIIDPTRYLCNNENNKCNVVFKDKILYMDTNHLSTAGSLYLKVLFDTSIASIQ